MNLRNISNLNELNLWPHQIEAVEKIDSYLTTYNPTTNKKSMLVQMPTGTGKSGVITTASRFLTGVKSVLILTPRISLRDQLYTDVKARFCNTIGYSGSIDKVVNVISDSKIPAPLKDDDVLVLTVQKLASFSKNHPADFRKFCRSISLIIVDEGHYEPATKWSKVVREINAPKLIFTATPYRNDLKLFDIDKDKSFLYTFKKATEDRFLRQVSFKEKAPLVKHSDFIDDVIDEYKNCFSKDPNSNIRVIIQCDDVSDIAKLASEIIANGYSVFGIHERLKETSGKPWARKSVPDPKKEDAIFWIHQYKLMEGIDDPRFRLLAIYKKIRNARSLVQQVGRVIRNPKQHATLKAFILDYSDGFHKNLWDNFRNYDRELDSKGIDALGIADSTEYLNGFLSVQPKISFLDGRFRSDFTFSRLKPLSDVQFPLKAAFFEKAAHFNFNTLKSEINDYFLESDRAYHVFNIEDDTTLFASVSFVGSNYLTNHAFVESDLHFTLVKQYGDVVAFYDTSGINLLHFDRSGLSSPVDEKQLQRLFKKDPKSEITSVAVKNTNLGSSVIRTRAITAQSIANTVPYLDDHAQICTNVEGYSAVDKDKNFGKSRARRYVGFSSGKVSQGHSGYVPLEDYLSWLDNICDLILSKKSKSQLFDRFAKEADKPKNFDPVNLLIEVSTLIDSYISNHDDSELSIEDSCVKVNSDGSFKLKVNNKNYEAKISYDQFKNKYEIESKDLSTDFTSKDDSVPVDIIKVINAQQLFRVIPQSANVIYVNGHFYKPIIKVGKKFDQKGYELGNCFLTDKKIGECKTEKGKESSAKTSGWHKDSLFYIIDKLGAGTSIQDSFGNPNVVICDDMNKESCDFILCDTDPKKPKVIFIHAKASSKGYLCSASSLHEVCAQASKNLPYLAMFNDQPPNRVKSNGWDKKWNDGRAGTVNKRIRKAPNGKKNTKQLWEVIRSTVNNPLVEKEVWLMVGNIFSKKVFETRLGKTTPDTEALQAAYLLQATMADVASVGAKLRIICGE